ncbi:MAG: lysophospholipid acyltransferase family protein [Rhodococcus sp. (in: high G+C Gram-positive bacteria)]
MSRRGPDIAEIVEPAVDHAWMPSSPCGAGCIARDSATVHRVIVMLRILVALFAFGLLPVLIVVGLLSPRARHRVTRLGARLLLLAVGIGLSVEDRRSAREKSRTESGAMFVAGHISWTDVLVLTALRPATFVARGDLVDWPVLGLLARSMKVLPVHRRNLRALPDTVDQVADRLRAGGTVVVFPEGTTWCGRAYGSFRPAMFQAAIDTETWVQPVRLRYVGITGERTTAPCFVGEETIGQSISRIFALKGIMAEVELVAPEPPGSDRRDLARRCEISARSGVCHQDVLHEPELQAIVVRSAAP